MLCADAASAQRQLRRAFEPAATYFIAGTGFGDRVHAAAATADQYDYNNGIAIGVQGERPWTRRTALMGTVAITPLSRVTRTFNETVGDRARIAIVGLDLGVAGRLKPSAPVFGYLGGGAVVATRPPSEDLSGLHGEPRVTLGVGYDALRRERAGFRVAYFAHHVFTRAPNSDYVAEGGSRDWTLILGGRWTFGSWGEDAR